MCHGISPVRSLASCRMRVACPNAEFLWLQHGVAVLTGNLHAMQSALEPCRLQQGLRMYLACFARGRGSSAELDPDSSPDSSSDSSLEASALCGCSRGLGFRFDVPSAGPPFRSRLSRGLGTSVPDTIGKNAYIKMPQRSVQVICHAAYQIGLVSDTSADCNALLGPHLPS